MLGSVQAKQIGNSKGGLSKGVFRVCVGFVERWLGEACVV